ncbi:lantibiotic dehydratase [Streptomyces sp. NPDC001107]
MEDLEQARAYLTAVADDAAVREAIAVSSLPLDRTLQRAAAGEVVKPKQLRRGAASALRYVKRMQRRATPFGLMAGVAPATFADSSEVRIGARHHKHVRPDLAWLIHVIRDLNRDPAVRSHLRVTANDLCYVRGDRLIVPPLLVAEDEDEGHTCEMSIPYTPAVRAAMDCARMPVLFRELASQVTAACPAEDEDRVEQQLGELVDQQILLTELHPPLTDPDPLGHVLRTLTATGRTALQEPLGAIADALDDYAASPIGSGYSQLQAAARQMRDIHPSDRPLHVDLGMDAAIVLPRMVATEMADAASLAWRLAPPPSRPLAAYHRLFLERYGLRGLVPVRELLDPHVGLGVPSPASPGRRINPHSDELTAERDIEMCRLAQRAAARSETEVLIDEDVADRLAHPRKRDAGAYIEPVARLFARSEEGLAAGDFRLVLSSMNYTRPGAMFGRFLHLLPKLRDPFARCVDDLTATWSPATAAHLVAPTIPARSANVAQVPRLTPDTLVLGAFADTADPQVLRLDDLAVGAHHDRLYVVSLRSGEEVVPLPFNANEMRTTAPDPVRMLFQIGAFRTPKWSMWSWGTAAERLPFLPRIRYGRTILASARWLPDQRLTDPTLDRTQWRHLLDQWREEWRVPDRVEAACADQLLPLDLRSAADVHILHEQLLRTPGTVVREEPLGGAYGTGWAGGRACELAVPLVPTEQRIHPATRTTLPLSTVIDPAKTRQVHRPGGDWLCLKVYAAADRHDEILACELPSLLRQAASLTDRWFYIRYQDDEPHLRIRFHGTSARLNCELFPAVHQWADRLAAAGGLRELLLDSYRPEIARYGGPEAMEAAELVFCADSRASVQQLQLRDKGVLKLPTEVLLAANHMDMASRLIGEGWQDWLLNAYPKGAHHHVFQRYRNEAVTLLAPLASGIGLPRTQAAEQLTRIWDQRAAALTHYGDLIRDTFAAGRLGTAPVPFRSVLHMHHNRLGGMDSETEQGSYAIARGVLQTVADQKRHLDKES